MSDSFIPDTEGEIEDVPYFDEVRKEDGWEGHGTHKSIDTLKTEVSEALLRLGGVVGVQGFTKGTFDTTKRPRDGYRIIYTFPGPNGKLLRGKMDIAALPVRPSKSKGVLSDAEREKSLMMALYMLRQALNGQWFLQQLSPGYAALMPFMLVNESTTLSELWSSGAAGNLLGPGVPVDPEDAVEGEFKELG